MKKFKPRALALAIAAAVGLTCFSAAPAMAATTDGVEPTPSQVQVEAPKYDDVIEALNRANEYWQSNNAYNMTHNGIDNAFWDTSAYHTGNMEAYYATGNETYRNYSTNWADNNNWMGNNYTGDPSNWKWDYDQRQGSEYVLFGDWQICFQSYIDLYNSERMEERNAGDEQKISRVKYVIDEQININPVKNSKNQEYGFWWWADSLYMVPPIYAKLYATTGDEKYLDELYENYQYAVELMYDGEGGIPTSEGGYTTAAGHEKVSGSNYSDKDDYKHLFFRDASYVWPEYPINTGRGETKPEIAKTVKNFWARGNGWVFAGLAKILPEIPESHDSYAYLRKIYEQMAEAIVQWQRTDSEGRGFWTQSMLMDYPKGENGNALGYETSGTAFFTYGLAWGLNSGILDKEIYLQPTYRAWKYLAEVALQSNGKVGYCQPIGSNASAAVSKETDQPFGYGAFLLAASEVSRLVDGVKGDVVDGEPNGDIYPYLLHKMVGKTAFELGSPHLFRDGEILHIDDDDYGVTPYKEGNEVYLPAGAIEKLGLTGVAANGSGYVTGSALETAGYSLWPFPYGGEEDGLGDLYVISKTSEFLYECDKNAVDMLRSMIGRIESYPVRPEQEAMPEDNMLRSKKIALDASMVTSSYTAEANHPAANVVDGYLTDESRWAADKEAYITIDLGEEMPVGCVGIYFMKYENASVKYKVGYRTNDTDYTYLSQDYVNGTLDVNGWDYADLSNQTARYIQIYVNGRCNPSNPNDENRKSIWASIIEVSVFHGSEKLTVNEDMISYTKIDESQNPPAAAFDGKEETMWAANGDRYLTVDLGEMKNIDYVNVRMKDYSQEDQGKDRAINYKVLYSTNNVSFNTAFDGKSVPGGGEYERRDIGKNARYIRIQINGASDSTYSYYWASVSEVEIYAYPEEESSVTPQETGTIKSELNYVSADADAAGAAENDLAILFTGKDIPAGAHYEIADAKGTVIYKDEPDPAAGTDLAVTVVPTDTNALYTASVIANTGEVLAAADASVYSVLAENLNMHATTDYSAADVRFNPARIANAVEALSHGGVFVGPTGAVTDELKLITTAETSGTTTTYTLLPEIVKMGIVFKSDGSNIYYGSGETAFTDSGIFDTIKVDNTTDGLSVTLSQSDGFPGAEAADISLSIPEKGGELH